MIETHEFPEYTDAAGVKWTADFFVVGRPRVVLCVWDVPGGELAYSYAAIEEPFAALLKRLPPADDRLAIVDRIRADVKAWREVAAHV